jgi:hypothetical protein
MHFLSLILGGILALASLAGSIYMLYEAFCDEVWKGFVSLLCGLYMLYWAIFEWEHDYKWPIFLGTMACSSAAGLLLRR